MPEVARLPRMVFVTGVDGCGKSTLATWLSQQLVENGVESRVIWSRFNNYFSKPLLALARLTGHNHKKTIDGVRYGFHDFENLGVFRQAFAFFQALDVNIATYFRFRRSRVVAEVVVGERGPWDSLVDVMSDTGLSELHRSSIGKLYTAQIRDSVKVLHISRSYENIISARPELVHDYKMASKISIYSQLADEVGWDVIDNNGSLEETKQQILAVLGFSAR